MYLYSIKFISEIEKNNSILKNYDNRKKAKFYMDVLKAEKNIKYFLKKSEKTRKSLSTLYHIVSVRMLMINKKCLDV